MTWSLYRWLWRLEAPLSIGMPPSGTLNRTRLYVPARNLWGALTAELAQQKSTGFPEYAKVGEAIRNDARLTYLYPAEEIGSSWRAWLPRYQSGEGLVWPREDESDEKTFVSDRDMRLRLLLTRPATAIDHASATAADGTLRETECIGQYWRGTAAVEAKPVALAGYLWVRDATDLAAAIETIKALAIGADTRYGLGRLRRLAWEPASDVFGARADLQGPNPYVTTERILAHASVSDRPAAPTGDLEALAEWDHGKAAVQPVADAPLWMPGTRVPSGRFEVLGSGLWRIAPDPVEE